MQTIKIGKFDIFVFSHEGKDYAVIDVKSLFGNISMSDVESLRNEALSIWGLEKIKISN